MGILANIDVKICFSIDQVSQELVILNKGMFPIKVVALSDGGIWVFGCNKCVR